MEKIIFKKRPIPLPAEYRPMYQIALIVLILKYCCRANTSSLLKLHLFSWCLYSNNNMDVMERFVSTGFRATMPHWTIDPALNRAIVLAIADGYCEKVSNNKYKLARKGLELVSKLESDKKLLYNEKKFLSTIGKTKISDSFVEEITIKKLNLC